MRIGKGGREVWIQASDNPVFDVDGKPFKVVKYATDISEQVRLRKEASMLSLVANETDNSVVITDAQGRIEYVNAGFTRLTGYTAEEALGRKPGELLHGKQSDADAKRRIREKLAAQQPFSEEILHYAKAGDSYWILLAVNPVFDARRQLTKFVSIQTDITQGKLKQIDFSARLDAISRSSAMIEFTPDGHLVTANAKLCTTMGYTLDELNCSLHEKCLEHHRRDCVSVGTAVSRHLTGQQGRDADGTGGAAERRAGRGGGGRQRSDGRTAARASRTHALRQNRCRGAAGRRRPTAHPRRRCSGRAVMTRRGTHSEPVQTTVPSPPGAQQGQLTARRCSQRRPRRHRG